MNTPHNQYLKTPETLEVIVKIVYILVEILMLVAEGCMTGVSTNVCVSCIQLQRAVSVY